jgi:hypothetical protein
MRPGQLTPNEFELAILLQLATRLPGLESVIPHLHVLSREFTGVGSFTNFNPTEAVAGAPERLGLHQEITIPGVANGLVVILFFKDGKVDCLEIAACGVAWDGVYDGFCIAPQE